MTRRIWIMLTLCIVSEYVAYSELIGDHVCQEEQRYRVNVTKYELKNVTVRKYVWCVQVPPRCSDYSKQRVNVTKIEEEEKIRYVSKCCNGYYEVDGKCWSESCRSCEYGVCNEDGICQCNFGYWGDSCDKECTDGNPTQSCRKTCSECAEGYCDFHTGNCTCPPKFIRCDMVCSEGHKCVQQCKCDTNTVCDPLTMKCEIDNKEYDLQDGSFHNFSNSGRFENQFQQLPNDHFSTPTALATMFPETTETNYFTSRSAQAVTIITTTENNMKQHDYTAKVSQEASGEYLLNSSIESEVEFPTNKQFDIPVVVNITKKSKWYSDKDKSSTLLNQISAIHRNETSHTVVIDNNLFILVVGVALFTVLIIMSAAVFCVLYKLKEKKKKFITTNNGNNEQRVSNAVPSVSVTTRSIFHTPLPEPPIFENPAFTAQIEGAQAKQSGTLETHVICNMNLPNIKAQNQTKLAEAVELFYDHPPPTGSYRPVLAPELPTSDCKKKSIDPIYDEIPCNQRIVSVATPPPAYTCSEEPMLYMNTK